MALDQNAQYPIGTTGPSAAYPEGEAVNESVLDALDGYPWEKEGINDLLGFQQALLRAIGQAASGNADTALVSQYLQGIIELASGRAFIYDDSGAVNAYVLDVQTNQQAPASLFDGQVLKFVPDNDNTGACTANPFAQGVTNIKMIGGVNDPLAGHIVTGIETTLIYRTAPSAHLELQLYPSLVKAGRKNILLGNFKLNQRAVSGTVILAAGIYGHDRFKAGSGGCTYTFATSANVTTITISAGTLEQEIEGENIQSGYHVLSWNGTAQAQIDGGGFAASGVTGVLTGGTNSIVEWNTGTISLPQLEPGVIITPFEERSIGEELTLCKRYYQVSSAILVASAAIVNVNPSWLFPVTLRAAPTMVFTFGTGSGGAFTTAADGFRQTVNNSVDSNFSYTADSEI